MTPRQALRPSVSTLLLAALLAHSLACGFGDAAASPDDCAGSPMGGEGVTIMPGPPIHEGYYAPLECQRICGPGYPTCAPTLAQGGQARYRCGAPPGGASCGAEHQPRPNVKGPCDSNGVDVEITRGSWEQRGRDCRSVCVGVLGSECREASPASAERVVIRCGEPRPSGC